MKLDWVNIWAEYNKAFDEAVERDSCKCCKQRITHEPEWDEQMKMIQKIVNKHLKRKS